MSQPSTNSERVGLIINRDERGHVTSTLELFVEDDPFSPKASWGRPTGPGGVQLRIEPVGDHLLRFDADAAFRLVQREGAVPGAVEVFALTDDYAVRLPLVPNGDETGDAFIEVRRRDGKPPGARDLQRLGLGNIHAALAQAMQDPIAVELLGKPWGAVPAPFPGRRGRPDLYYAKVAQEYVLACEQDPVAPLKLMVKNSEWPWNETLSADQIRGRLTRARGRKLLTKPAEGKAGGELTDKCKSLLRSAGLLDETGDDHGER